MKYIAEEYSREELINKLERHLQQIEYRYDDDPRNVGNKVELTGEWLLIANAIKYIKEKVG